MVWLCLLAGALGGGAVYLLSRFLPQKRPAVFAPFGQVSRRKEESTLLSMLDAVDRYDGGKNG